VGITLVGVQVPSSAFHRRQTPTRLRRGGSILPKTRLFFVLPSTYIEKKQKEKVMRQFTIRYLPWLLLLVIAFMWIYVASPVGTMARRMEARSRTIGLQLKALDSLQRDLRQTQGRLDIVLNKQEVLQRENTLLLEELEDASLSRREKLMRLRRYLLLIDSTLQRQTQRPASN
jgi:hypothetical protein